MADQEPKAKRCSSKAEGSEGDWSWVLVTAMFVSTGLVFGLMRSLGVFFVEFVHYFEESAQAISWISSIGLAAQQFFSKSTALYLLIHILNDNIMYCLFCFGDNKMNYNL